MITALAERRNLGKTLQHHFLAFHEDESPVVLFIDGEAFVCVYSTLLRLQENMEVVGVERYTVKNIIDQESFFDSLRGHPVRVMLDPYLHKGKTRFTEVFWD